jgi:hypothetical protein
MNTCTIKVSVRSDPVPVPRSGLVSLHLKRITTRKGVPTSRSEGEHAWTEAWDELEQWRIQQWIECIPQHIQQIIELEGDNNYREGKMDKARSFKAPLEDGE